MKSGSITSPGDWIGKGTVLFRVEFFVDDKRLGAALIALVGIANGQPIATPVVNATKSKSGKVEAVVKSSSSLERFAEQLKPHKGHTIRADDVRKMMKEIGLAEASYTYMLERARHHGLIKKSGKGSGTQYVVV